MIAFKWLEVRVERLLERLRDEEPAERLENDLRAMLALDEARIGGSTRRVRTLETERRTRRNHRKKRRRR